MISVPVKCLECGWETLVPGREVPYLRRLACPKCNTEGLKRIERDDLGETPLADRAEAEHWSYERVMALLREIERAQS